MKITGLLLMLGGWVIVLAALALLGLFHAQELFVFSGFAVEILGLVLFIRSHGGVKGESQ